MRCLYCGKELALLKRLTGGGEFCSDVHKQSYQEEYNRLALSRLLQAQTKAEDHKTSAKAAAPQTAAPPAAKPVSAKARQAPAAQAIEPAQFEPSSPARPDTSPHDNGPEYSPDEREEMAPAGLAGFLADRPAPRAGAEAVPQSEDPLCDAGRPALPDWQRSDRAAAGWKGEPGADLPAAKLFSLGVRPQANGSAQLQIESGIAPKEFSNPPLSMDLRQQVSEASMRSAGSAEIRVPLAAAAAVPDRTLETALEFPPPASSHALARPAFTVSGIELPAADAEVGEIELPRPASPPEEPSAQEDLAPQAEVSDGTPRAALEALSRLRQEIIEHELEPAARAGQAEASPVIEPFAFERLFGKPAPAGAAAAAAVSRPAAAVRSGPKGHAPASAGGVLVAPEAEDTEPEPAATQAARSEPREAVALLDLDVKPFAPPKAKLAPGFQAFTAGPHLQLPRVASLPLRPKLALGAAPPAPVEEKKPGPERKKIVPPVVRPPQGRTAAALAKSAQPTESKEKAEPSAPPAAEKPAPEPAAALVGKPEPEPTPREQQKAPAAAKKPVEPEPPAAAEVTAPVPEPAPIAAKKPAQAAPAPPAREIEAPVSSPSFGMEASAKSNRSFWSALPAGARIGIGLAVLILIALALYTKVGSRTATNPGDAAGPSIMMGDGGWVSDWGGDTTGLHKGRQITMYQPSLKLSDYRIEFQGQIESNCIAWVFRAADPQNYYVMKLSIPDGKVLLSKSIVAGGKEMTAGATATKIVGFPGKNYAVRMDVRGSKFTTYVQGEQADIWTDDQLKVGGVGLLNDRGDRAQVRALTISYLTAK